MVTLILTRIVFVLSIPLCLYAVYFGVVALFGLRKKLPAAPQAKPEKRFALVVAARNEAAVIGHLVDSLYGQDYPRELYEVIVAPNNCTDDTEAVAAGRGARIFRPEGVIRSKGEVLTQVVDKIVLAEEFDAMCVFDADQSGGRPVPGAYERCAGERRTGGAGFPRQQESRTERDLRLLFYLLLDAEPFLQWCAQRAAPLRAGERKRLCRYHCAAAPFGRLAHGYHDRGL